jgi:nitrogen PTS system EIIA component
MTTDARGGGDSEGGIHLLQLAEHLGLPISLVDRLHRRSLLGGRERRGRWSFDRIEVDQQIDLGMPDWPHDELHAVAQSQRDSRFSLAAAVRAGGVLLDAPVSDARSVFEHAITTLPLPTDVNREDLVGQLLARERLSSTALENGVAIPHGSGARPQVGPPGVVVLVRTKRPIAFGPPANGLTDLLFLLLAADRSQHLVLLARIAALVRVPLVGRVLRLAATPSEVIDLLESLEQTMFQPACATSR